MNKNILITIDYDYLSDILEEKFSYEESEDIINRLKEKEEILDGFDIFMIIKNNDVEILKTKLGEEIFNSIKFETLYNSIQYYEESADFGIKEYDCFHFHYDEVHDGLADYFNSETYTDEIFNSIKEVGLEKFLEEKYKDEVWYMINMRLNEIKNKIKNREVEVW